MEFLNLQLFQGEKSQSNVNKRKYKTGSLTNKASSLEDSINSAFPSVRQESQIEFARKVLCEVAVNQTDEQLQVFLTELQHLLNTWLDNFEKDIFGGVTLRQLLKDEK